MMALVPRNMRRPRVAFAVRHGIGLRRPLPCSLGVGPMGAFVRAKESSKLSILMTCFDVLFDSIAYTSQYLFAKAQDKREAAETRLLVDEGRHAAKPIATRTG